MKSLKRVHLKKSWIKVIEEKEKGIKGERNLDSYIYYKVTNFYQLLVKGFAEKQYLTPNIVSFACATNSSIFVEHHWSVLM